MAKKGTLWPITRATRAKHTILRKYLDAWLPILGAGRYAHEHLVLIDGFAGPGRYSGGEPGSPLIMLTAYVDHSAALDGTGHFFFIEEHHERCEHLRSEVAQLSLPPKVHLEILEGSFVDEFPSLIDRLTAQFGQLSARRIRNAILSRAGCSARLPPLARRRGLRLEHCGSVRPVAERRQQRLPISEIADWTRRVPC